MSFPGADDLYARFEYVYGVDWSLASGTEFGVTQTSSTSATAPPRAVWNHPLELLLSSTNAYGWPQLVLTVLGPDFLGRDVVRGYGCARVPIASGRYQRSVQLWAPQPASFAEWVLGIVLARRTEYLDPKFVARGPGREVTRVCSYGSVNVVFDVTTRNMAAFGFSEPASGCRVLSTVPL
eukprot:m51a1_g186 putative b9 domain-containing protein 1 (180) ;mRNA; f:603835-604613